MGGGGGGRMGEKECDTKGKTGDKHSTPKANWYDGEQRLRVGGRVGESGEWGGGIRGQD